MSAPQTAAELHDDLVAYGMDCYVQAATDAFIQEAAGGRVPGMKAMSEDGLRQFFRSIPAPTWLLMARQDPKGAVRMLNRFRAVETKNAAQVTPLPPPAPPEGAPY